MTKEAVAILSSDSTILREYCKAKWVDAMTKDMLTFDEEAMLNLFMFEQECHHVVLSIKDILVEDLMVHPEEFQQLWA